MTTLPTGTVTFLFTDIEGSTDLVQRIGDQAFTAILDRHHRLMREAFGPFGGVEVDTQGDAFFVAFREAPDAVAAAIAAQRAMAAHPWPEGIGVRVRMGLHTGEPMLGPVNYVGIDVHRAARISSVGWGGQIVLSERTHALVRDALPDGVVLRDLGEHRLKDLAQPEHLFDVVIPGMPSDFPPLRSLDAQLTNLPSLHLTSFIGREQELAEVRDLLREARLVTLVGPGGTGKTRLALQVAAESLPDFPKGVWLVELAPLADPDFVVGAVAAVFGVREAPGRPLLDALTDYLRGRALLIVLDNCEHLVEASARLAGALLQRCRALRLIATSREPLGVAGERAYRVPPLRRPDVSLTVSPETVMASEAGRLFVERAIQSNPRFALTAANAPAVSLVLARLDGIPLAIELAAARVKVLSVEQIARRLDDRFRLLTGGSRAGLAHHQTLQAAVGWSYDLLSDPEQVVFRRLSVFAGGHTLEAAETVSGVDPLTPEDVLDLLARLVDKSLIATESLDDGVRYRMLETIRHFSRERLLASDEAEEIRRRHLEWCLALAGEAEAGLRSGAQLDWLHRLDLEHDNLRAALEWARAGRDAVEDGLRLAARLHRYWVLRGLFREGREWLETLLGKAFGVSPEVEARAAYAAAVLALQQGDFVRAEALAAVSLERFREQADREGMALALNVAGLVARQRADYARTRALLEESLAHSRAAGARWAQAEALNLLGVAARRQGDRQAAVQMFEESLVHWRALGDRSGLATSLAHLGVVARLAGDLHRARALHEESLALRRELQDRRHIAAALASLGVVSWQLGDDAGARAQLEESLALSRELGDRQSVTAALCTLGLIAHFQHQDRQAAEWLQEALTLARELDDRVNLAAALCNLGYVAARLGLPADAAAHFSESLRLYRDLRDHAGMAYALEGWGALDAAIGRPDRAALLFGAADAVRGAEQAPLAPAEQAEQRRVIADLRATLGPEVYDRQFARGRATSVDELLGVPAG